MASYTGRWECRRKRDLPVTHFTLHIFCPRPIITPRDFTSLLTPQASDAWAVGLLAFEILTLSHPFYGGSIAKTVQRISAGVYDETPLFNASYPDELKRVASSTELLHFNPKERLTLEKLVSRPIFAPYVARGLHRV